MRLQRSLLAMEDEVNATAEQLAAIARRWVEVGWQQGDAEAVYAMYAPGFVDLGAAEGRAATREGNVEGIMALYRAFPDFYATVDDVIVDAGAGKVVVRWSATGTHQGTFMGIAATGNQVEFRGIEALRVEGDLIVERAGEWDGIAILEQIGALPLENDGHPTSPRRRTSRRPQSGTRLRVIQPGLQSIGTSTK